MKIFDLPCFDTRKSFYGKAQCIEFEDGTKVLKSYDTFVAQIQPSGELLRTWGGNSQTTSRHFNSFLIFYGLPPVKFNTLEGTPV